MGISGIATRERGRLATWWRLVGEHSGPLDLESWTEIVSPLVCPGGWIADGMSCPLRACGGVSTDPLGREGLPARC